MLDKMLEEGICERGNYAFHNQTGHAVLFARVDDKFWLQAAYSPGNYPAWDVSKFQGSEENLVNHINDNLGSWYIDKTQCDLNENDGVLVGAVEVVMDVVEHVMKMAEKYDFDPTQTPDGLCDVITDSASVLRYKLSRQMFNDCFNEITEYYGK